MPCRREVLVSVSREFLERAAAETGFQPGALEKVVRLGEVANDVTRHPLLGGALALKGGTALNLCWGHPTRLSVDLDYNYVASVGREGMLEARPTIERAVEELAARRAYLVQRSPDAFAGRKIFLRYTSAFGAPDRIEVDLNFLYRLPIEPAELRRLWQPGGLDLPKARCVSLVELCIGKLMALLDRGAARDAWDVAQLPHLAGEALTTLAFRARFLVIAATLDHDPATYTRERLEARLDERTIRDQLLPMLVSGEQPEVADLVERAWAVAGPLVQLTREESEFVANIGRGEFRPDLLPDGGAAELEQHPAVQWKLLNVRQHLRKGT